MRLRPGVVVLVRETGQTQVGLARPLFLDGLSPREEALLASLEGRASHLSSTERQEFACVVDALREHDFLTEDSPIPSLAHALVRIRVVDGLTSAIASGLAREGVGALSIIDPRSAFPHGPFGPGAAGLTRASALAKSLREAVPEIRIAGPFEVASLEILRGHGALDLALPRELASRDVPHLRIVTDEDGIDIGPLVVPGETACETCLGIARTEANPWWPRLALQLGGAGRNGGMRLPEAATLLAAGIAVREVSGVLAGEPATTLQWRVPLDGGAMQATPRWPHPDCRCGAADSVGDVCEAAAAAFSASSASIAAKPL